MKSVDMSIFWPLVILLGVGTFLLRASFIFAWQKIPFPPALRRALRYIPASVLPALVVPAIVFHQGAVEILGGHERLAAGVVAALVAWKTKNMLFTIIAGMSVLFLIKASMG